ncbi:MAG: 50S ribosomal protein L9 [Saprospiraceae bacterium]
MQVILTKNVDNLGKANDVVTVKPGYGRNYLIPQRFAIIANKRNMSQLDELIRKQAAADAKELAGFQAIAAKLTGTVLKIGAKAGTSGKIFGSVTNIQLSEAMQSQAGVEVDRKVITLLEEVKELGTYTAEVNLHADVKVNVSFEVTEDK